MALPNLFKGAGKLNFLRATLLSFVTIILILPAFAQGPEILKDINSPTTLHSTSTAGYNFKGSNGIVFFAADNGLNGLELWKTNGTEVGTMLVKDINPGSSSSNPTNFVELNGVLYFTATSSTNGNELWKSDGTEAGTVMVKDLSAGTGSSSPQNLAVVNNKIFFTANANSLGRELYVTDGTDAGTALVKDINPGTGSSSPGSMHNLNGQLFFTASNPVYGLELWKSDGTDAGTVMVKDVAPGGASPFFADFIVFNDKLVFTLYTDDAGNEPWISDGTDAGTHIIKDIQPGDWGSEPDHYTVAGTVLYFVANDGINGYELWKTDGTDAGTALVKDIVPGSDGAFPEFLTLIGNTLYFSAWEDNTGQELWKSDGTAAGTVLVKDISPGNSSIPLYLINLNGTLLFRAGDAANGVELWKSDGTEAGTVIVKDLNPGANSSLPLNFTQVNNKLYFTGTMSGSPTLFVSDGTDAGTKALNISAINSGTFATLYGYNDRLYFLHTPTIITGVGAGREPWVSDGTDAGTKLLKDINQFTSSGNPGPYCRIGDVVYFAADNGVNGNELWKTDGTAAGTVLVADIAPGTSSSTPQNLTNVNGTLFFTASVSGIGRELWKSDGTAAGTVLVKDLYSGNSSSTPTMLTNVNGTVFFTGLTQTEGTVLFKSDGTDAGTVMVKDLLPGSTANPNISLPVNVNGTLFFRATVAPYGTELWKSDGTEAGTILVKDIVSGTGSSGLDNLIAYNGKLFFSANDGINGNELWESDGTEAGTQMFVNIATGSFANSNPSNFKVAAGKLYFTAFTAGTQYEPWVSDGTPANTFMITEVVPGGSGSVPSGFTEMNGYVYFSATSNSGRELWRTDNTAAGTTLVRDIVPGTGSSTPDQLTSVNNTLYFIATMPDGGVELFSSDGTEAGTVGYDLYPGSTTSSPNYLTALNEMLIFSANHTMLGTEIWKAVAVPAPSASFSITGDTTACEGVVKTYKATNVVGSNVSYHWSLPDGGGTMTVEDSIITVTWTSPGDRRIELYLSNPSGSTAPKQLTVHVITGGIAPTQAPVISQFGRTLTASNFPPGTYCRWYRNDVEIPGADQPSYYAALDGSYTAKFVSTCAIGPSSNAILFATAAQPQTITFDTLADRQLTPDLKIKLHASSSSGLPVFFQKVAGPGYVQNDTLYVTGTGILTGDIVIKAMQPGNEIYSPADDALETVRILRGNQYISFDSIPDLVFASQQVQMNAITNAGLPLTFSIVNGNNIVSLLSGNKFKVNGAGSVTIRASQAGNLNYLSAAPVDRTFCIGVRSLGNITGDAHPCINTYRYNAQRIPGAEYVWTLSGGGTLTTNKDTAWIAWDTPGAHTLTVKANSLCDTIYSDIASLNISTTSNPPAPVSGMIPVNGAQDQQLPLRLSWIPGISTTVFDIYVWDADDPQPVTPYASNIEGVYIDLPLNSLAYNNTYKWRVVSKNPCQFTSGPVQEFSVIPLPDLQVSNVQAPATATSGQTITITWDVTNVGPGSTLPGATWYDGVYLAMDTVPFVSFAGSPNWNPGSWNNLTANGRPLLLGKRIRPTGLSSGQSYSNSLQFTLPLDYSFPVYVYVITDNEHPNWKIMQESVLNDTARKATQMQIIMAPTPDLRVDSVFTPSTTFSGSTINVTYKVRNYGVLTPAGSSWIDSVFLSPNPLFDRATAIPLNAPKYNGSYYPNTWNQTVHNTTQLLQDSFYTKSVSVVIPNFIFGNWFIYVKTNAKASGTSSLYEGPLTDNNLGQALLQVYLTPTPKLTVNNLNIPLTSASTTQPIGVNWNIKNEGFRDNIEFNKGHIITMGTCTVACPTFTPGQICYSSSVTNDSLVFGSSYWVDRVYLSTDPGGLNTANAVLVKEVQHGQLNSGMYWEPSVGSFVSCPALASGSINISNVIHPNSVFPKTAGFNIPSNLPEGSYYVYVYTNPTKSVFEYPGTPQIERSALPIQIKRPDVRVSSLTVPTAATGGQVIPIDYTVFNDGPGDVFNHIRKDRIYISTQPTFNGSAQLIGTNTVTENILSNSGVNHSFQFTVPHPTSGVRYFYVLTNYDSAFLENNHSNNLSSAAASNITPALPADLVVASVNPGDSAFTVFQQKVVYTINNNGVGSAVGTWTDSIFISCNPVFSPQSSFYAGRKMHLNKVVGTMSSYTDTFTLNMPYSHLINSCFTPSMHSNVYFYVKANADTGAYEGTALNNNIGSSGSQLLVNPYIDHTIPFVSGPDTTTVGDPYPTNWSVKNIGYNPGTNQYYTYWYDGLFFSPDSVADIGDNKAGDYLKYNRINRGEEITFTKSPYTPLMPTGDYYVYVHNNYNQIIPGEINVGNNVNFIRNAQGAAKKIHVIQPLMPDLTDSIISAPTSVAAGQPVTIIYKVTNKGQGVTFPGSNIQTTILLSNNTTVTPNDGDRVLATRNRQTPLNAGQVYYDTVTTVIPASTIDGNFFLISQVNSNNAILETSLTNNLGISQISVFRPPLTDLVVGGMVLPDTVTLGYTIDTAKWVVANISGELARGSSKDGIYLSSADQFDSTAILIGIKNKYIDLQPLESDTVRMAAMVTGVVEGNYNVYVKTDVQNNILESDKENNTGMSASRIYVKVKELPMNVDEPNTLARDNRYYKLVIPDSLLGSTILVTLRSNDSLSVHNEMYMGAGYVPTPASYDYRFETPNYGNQQILISDVNSNVFYIMYRSMSVNAPPQNVTLKAVKLPFAVLDVHTNAGANIGNVTIRIRGSLFEPGMTARLSNGSTNINASVVYFTNSTQVFATFPLQGKPQGIYDVTLIKDDLSEATLPQSFSIVPPNNGGLITGGGVNTGAGNGNEPGCDPGAASGMNSQLSLDLIVPSPVLTNRPVVILINFSNPTNFDIPVQSRILYSEDNVKMAFTKAGIPEGTTSLYIEFTEPGGPPGIIRPGGSGTITVHCISPTQIPLDRSVLFKLQ